MKLIKLHNIVWAHTTTETLNGLSFEMEYTRNFEVFTKNISDAVQFISDYETIDNKIISFDIKVQWLKEEELNELHKKQMK